MAAKGPTGKEPMAKPFRLKRKQKTGGHAGKRSVPLDHEFSPHRWLQGKNRRGSGEGSMKG